MKSLESLIQNNMLGPVVASRTTANKRISTMSYLPSSHATAVPESDMRIHAGSTNRFIEMATIRFHLPASAQATLRVMDQTGQTVCVKSGQFDTGDNHFLLHRDDLPESGLYLYRIETTYGSGIRKIMLY
ncbi:MAG: T9SS type A sorting domain-containing protein [Saprospiraceae bacterium]|nr:T9SS type A sorting domain-containing protein [Saprospiraceae bacterium]